MEAFATRTATVASGTDKTMINLFHAAATPTTRGQIYELQVGGIGTPGDQSADFLLNLTTAVGTEGSGFVPKNIVGGPAGEMDSGVNHSAEPTYTAGALLYAFQLYHRNLHNWKAYPGHEPRMAATQNAGAGLKTPSSSSTQAHGATLKFRE